MELLMKPNGTKQKTQAAVRAHITLKSLCWKVSMVQPKDNTLFNTPSKAHTPSGKPAERLYPTTIHVPEPANIKRALFHAPRK